MEYEGDIEVKNLKKLFRQAKGNFGHRGRPGKVGGSAKGLSGVLKSGTVGKGGHYPMTEKTIPKEGKTTQDDMPEKMKSERAGVVDVTNDTVDKAASEILDATQERFGDDLTDVSDYKWEKNINPWIDKYISEHYNVDNEQTMSELNDMIGIELENRNLGTHF